MQTTIYVNTPLSLDEHEALKALAKGERRSKGQQLRLLALKNLKVTQREKKGVKP
jgi:hypothetical protein